MLAIVILLIVENLHDANTQTRSWMSWYVPMISTLWQKRQEDKEFKTSLGYKKIVGFSSVAYAMTN